LAAHPNPERHARYRWAAEIVSGGRVLDAGCGAGWGTAVLAKGGAEAVGIDLSPVAISEARNANGNAARFEQRDMREMPFADGEFDHVVCFEAIAQVANLGHTLDEFRRVLRPGGKLLVSAPNRAAYPAGNPLHLSEIDSAELETLLGERFAKVAVHRQQSYHASLLGSAAMLAHDDPEMPVTASIVKALGEPPGSELHAVAAATDGELPVVPAWLALGELVDYREQQSQLEEWRERAVEAEARVLAQARKLQRCDRKRAADAGT
jgi:SAM-dependent methyltransferase